MPFPRDERGQRAETQRSVKPESYTCSDQPPSPTPATARQGRESLGHGEAAAVDRRRSCGLRATPAWQDTARKLWWWHLTGKAEPVRFLRTVDMHIAPQGHLR